MNIEKYRQLKTQVNRLHQRVINLEKRSVAPQQAHDREEIAKTYAMRHALRDTKERLFDAEQPHQAPDAPCQGMTGDEQNRSWLKVFDLCCELGMEYQTEDNPIDQVLEFIRNRTSTAELLNNSRAKAFERIFLNLQDRLDEDLKPDGVECLIDALIASHKELQALQEEYDSDKQLRVAIRLIIDAMEAPSGNSPDSKSARIEEAAESLVKSLKLRGVNADFGTLPI